MSSNEETKAEHERVLDQVKKGLKLSEFSRIKLEHEILN